METETSPESAISKPEAQTAIEVTEKPFTPSSLEELIGKLDELGVNYTEYKDDTDRGPIRLMKEVQSSKNALSLRTTEQGEQIVRVSRVFRSRVTTKVGEQTYVIKHVKKVNNKTGEEVPVTGDESEYTLSKGLLVGQTPEDVMDAVIQEDLGDDVTRIGSDFLGTTTEFRPASPGSKLPWINSEYQFETYDISVEMPTEKVNQPIVSPGNVWNSVRVAEPISS